MILARKGQHEMDRNPPMPVPVVAFWACFWGMVSAAQSEQMGHGVAELHGQNNV